MKKFLIRLALLCAMMALACTAAMATNATLTPSVADGMAQNVTLTADGADKVQVSLQNVQSDKQFVIFVLSDDSGVPTESNIVYIDQDASNTSGIGFTVYPQTIETGKTYYIYVSSNADQAPFQTFTLIGTFVVDENGNVDVKIGDVNGDESIDISDAMAILNYIARLTDADSIVTAAADTNNDGEIDISDAMAILNYIARLITSLGTGE